MGLEVLQVPRDEFVDPALVGRESDRAVIGLPSAEPALGQVIQKVPRVDRQRQKREFAEVLTQQPEHCGRWFAEGVRHACHHRVTLEKRMRNQMELLTLIETAFQVSDRGAVVGIPALQDAD